MNIDATTPQLMAVKKWVDANATLDVSKIVPAISRNFKFHSFPNSDGLPDLREQDMDAHLQWMKGLLALLTKIEMTAHEVIEAPGKVVIHATVVLSLVDGTKYDYDTVAIISVGEEDGEIKVLEYKGFSDPYKRSAFYAGMAKIAGKGKPAS